MSLLAKAIVKNKCWIVEDNGHQIGTILANPQGVVYQHDHKKEQFASLKLLSDRYNIVVDRIRLRKSSLKAIPFMGSLVNINLTTSYGMSNIGYLSLLKVARAKVFSVLATTSSNLIMVGSNHIALN